nr:hypothetical protein [Tanacetum cinerariifolium]
FPYAVGTKLTDNGWGAHSGGGMNPILVTATNLTYPRYTPSTGNAAALTGTGEDINRTFRTVYPRTDVYLAGLVSVSNAPQTTAGDYFLHLGPTAIGSTYRGRIFVRKTAAGTVQFGVSGSSGTAVYTTAEYALNTTYLLLLRHSFDEMGNQSDLFVNPDARTNSYRVTATADASATETANSPSDIGSVALRQGTGSLQVTVDGLTVATAFPISSSGPLPVTLTDFTAEAKGQAVQVAWHTASELNAARFEVERSVDATTFTKLTSATTLTGAAPNATVQVFDALGRTLATATADASGTAHLALPTGLVPGVYVVRTGTQAVRLLLE